MSLSSVDMLHLAPSELLDLLYTQDPTPEQLVMLHETHEAARAAERRAEADCRDRDRLVAGALRALLDARLCRLHPERVDHCFMLVEDAIRGCTEALMVRDPAADGLDVPLIPEEIEARYSGRYCHCVYLRSTGELIRLELERR